MRAQVLLAPASLAALALAACGDNLAPAPPDIAARLAALPGVVVAEVTPPAGTSYQAGYRFFDLWFPQPSDHVAGGGLFLQYAALMHVDDAAPLVVYDGGYNATRTRTLTEPAALLGANQLSIEYRFYGNSHGEDIDWSHLDVADAVADEHAIVQAMAQVYPDAPRIATGGSKGGENALEHHRLYPDDYAGVVAYVAPVITDLPDARYAHVLDDIGLDACRTRLRALQREMLTRRSAMESRAAAEGAFTDVGLGKAVETAIVELEFSYWMTLTRPADCAALPATTATDDELYAFLRSVSPPTGYDNQTQDLLGSQYVYQVLAQLGYPVWEHAHLDDLMQYSYEDMKPFLAENVAPPTYDPTVARDLAAWVETDASRVLLLDGQWDPWGAGYPARVADGKDAYRLVVPEGSHWSTGIFSLGAADAEIAKDALRRWGGVEMLKAARVERALPELGRRDEGASAEAGEGASAEQVRW